MTMTMITVQAIQPDEIDQFIAISNASGHETEIRKYLDHLLCIGSVRTEWCYILKEDNKLRGRLAFWTLPKVGKPLAMVLLELPWKSNNWLALGKCLLQKTLSDMLPIGVNRIEYVLDVPVMAPQWQEYPEERTKLLEQVGFKLDRETFRFEWNSQDTDTELAKHEGLVFKTLKETDETTFIEAIARVSSSTLDGRAQFDQEQYGPNVHAHNLFKDLQQMDFDPSWWQLAYTLNGDLVGLVMPTKSPTFSTIGYIGVVPEQRGHGYIDVLLNKGTVILFETGAKVIRTDTDVKNIPMANAFKRRGYVQFARRREYSIGLQL